MSIGRWVIVLCIAILSACGGGGGGGGGAVNLPGTLQLAGTSFDATEGTVVNIRVARSGGSSGVARVDYATADGTGAAGSDYTVANGTLTWANGVSGNQTISIPITDDNTAEPSESFTVTLNNVSGATLGANSSATVNIIDNDTAALAAFGAITALNSVTVNGIRYDTNAANVNVNGLPASVSDLELGQVVALEGEVNFSDATGRADEIGYSALVIGPVENIDTTLDRLIVLGQTVLTNADTVFDPSIDPDTFAGLTTGATAQISGFPNADGDIMATRIEPDTTNTDVQLIGKVTGLDLVNMLFSINRLTVDYGSATRIDLPMGMPSNGLLVLVRGSLTNGILVVDEIASVGNLMATPGERGHLGGIITWFVSPTNFDLNGFPITTNASTRFINGVVGDLQANAEITIDGEVSAGGGTVLANEVTFGRPVNDRETLPFDFDNFTNISVLGLSRVTVVQGPDFSVEVTANANMVNDVQVTQTGDTVNFGLNNTHMLNAFVTMPVLNQIDVGAGALANVTLEDFDQLQMTVNVGGVSSVRGEELRIGDLTATVSGVSVLDLGEIRPIGSADIDVSGVSQATLNMEPGSTLTGSVRTGQGTGHSTLFYYGTNVTVNVTTDSLSRVTKLGDSRP
ncbi:MAG: DUF5666 domain-containing protein [Gammaproteobacteria bacterium]|nr:DUF5666 domain-containing protein [Gammaproteobacteria bacterium]